jgi:hypothetical protein
VLTHHGTLTSFRHLMPPECHARLQHIPLSVPRSSLTVIRHYTLMEKKILAYAFALLLLVAGIIFWVSRESVEEVQANLEHAQAGLEAVQAEFQDHQALLTARKEAAALITEASGLDQQNQRLREEIRTLHRQRADLVNPPPRQRPGTRRPGDP